MNVGAFRDKIRRLLGDEDGVLLTDDFLSDWINEGQLDIVKKTECLQDTETWTPTSSTQAYALPTDFMFAKRVSLNGTRLEPVEMDDADIQSGAVDESGFTFPAAGGTYYLWNNYIYIPATTVSTGNLVMHYIKYPEEVSAATDNLSIPRQMQDDLMQYVIAKCRERLDEMDEARMAEAKYSSDITETAAVEDWQNRASYPAVRLAYGDY